MMRLRKRKRDLSPVHIARIQCEKNEDSNFFKIAFIDNNIGYGVFAKKDFEKGDFLLEYSGELISVEEGKQRENQYSEEDGSFLFYFSHDGKEKCVDATNERNKRAGRMVNDSQWPNAKMKVIEVSGTPHLCLFALKDIKTGEELRYDYGVKDLPWRIQPFPKPVKELTLGYPLCQKKSQTVSCNLTPSALNSDEDLSESAAVGKKTQCSHGSPACHAFDSDSNCFVSFNGGRHVSEIKSNPSTRRACNIDGPEDEESDDKQGSSVEEDVPGDADCSVNLTEAKRVERVSKDSQDSLHLKERHSANVASAYGYNSDFNPCELLDEDNNSGGVPKTKSSQEVLQPSGYIDHSADEESDDNQDSTVEEDVPGDADCSVNLTEAKPVEKESNTSPESLHHKKRQSANVASAYCYGYDSDYNPFESDEDENSGRVRKAKSSQQVVQPSGYIDHSADEESDDNQDSTVEKDVPGDADGSVNLTEAKPVEKGSKTSPGSLHHKKRQSANVASAYCYGYDSDYNPFESDEDENSGRVRKTKSSQQVVQPSGYIDHSADEESDDNQDSTVEKDVPGDADCSVNLTEAKPVEKGSKTSPGSLHHKKRQSANVASAYCYGYDSDYNPFESDEDENSGRVRKTKSSQQVLQSLGYIDHSSHEESDDYQDSTVEEDEVEDSDGSVNLTEAKPVEKGSKTSPDRMHHKKRQSANVASAYCYGYDSDYNPFESDEDEKFLRVRRTQSSQQVVQPSGYIDHSADEESDDNQESTVEEDVVEDSQSSVDPVAVQSTLSRFNFEHLETSVTKSDSTSVQVPLISSSFPKKSRPFRLYDSNSSEESSDLERVPKRTRKKGHVNKLVTSTSDCPLSSISVVTTQNKKGRRQWDRQNFCVYCDKSFSKLPRHFERKHKQEREVAEILSKSKGSKERKWMWVILENKGNHAHNIQVLSEGNGSLVPAMRQSVPSEARDYLPCEHCLGYYIRHDLWKHKKRCPSLKLKGVDPSKGRIQGCSALLLPYPKTFNEAFSQEVLSKMNSDEIGLIVRQDTLIQKFGLRMFMKVSQLHQYQYISQKMRMLGRLVPTMRGLSASKLSSLKDALCPRHFRSVTEAVREVAGFDPVKKLYQTPSLALKLGHSLKGCAAILKGEALQSGDKVGQETAESFEDLCTLEWSTEVSHHALGTLTKRHWNKPQNLPLGEDVVKLNKHLKEVAQENVENLSKAPSDTSAWYELAKATLCQLIMFNRRRSGEVERILLEECSKITDEMNEDILNSLSKWEQNLCRKLVRLEIRGKRGRKVPVLMTGALHANVRKLISARSSVDVSESNIYLFARVFPSQHPIRGPDCIRKFAVECDVTHPENLTSTKLRKQIGTMSQVFNLQNNELDILATFMGHDINVHRNFYRLPEQTLQLVKVSRILLAMEKGKSVDFRGKALDEIEIDLDGDEEDEHDESEDSGNEEHEDIANAETSELESVENNQKPANTHSEDTHVAKETPLPDSDESEQQSTRNHSQNKRVAKDKRRRQKKTNTKRKWSNEETQAVLKHLRRNVHLLRVPGKRECMKCIQKEPAALCHRDWKAVKYKVYNLIQQQRQKGK